MEHNQNKASELRQVTKGLFGTAPASDFFLKLVE
jgi:hypothetical protein